MVFVASGERLTSRFRRVDVESVSADETVGARPRDRSMRASRDARTARVHRTGRRARRPSRPAPSVFAPVGYAIVIIHLSPTIRTLADDPTKM